jgi:uncharacterized protein (PEP-CTERM system associated)
MAKRARAPAALMALLLAPAAHAEVRFTTGVSGSETYTDNVSQQTADLAQSSFVTEVTPTFTATSNGPRLNLSAQYQLHLYSYSRKTDNTNNSSSQYQVSMRSRLIDELLDLDASATRQTTSRTAFGPQGNDSLYSNSNRTNITTYSISPTLRHRFGGTADAYLRYSRNRVSGDGNVLGTSNGENITATLNSGQNFRVIGWGLTATQDEFSEPNFGTSTSQNFLANLSYRATQTISLTATAGYDKYDYSAENNNATSGANWTVGFIWTPSSRTRLQVSYGRRFFGNTGTMAFTYRGHRSAMNASYSDNITTSRQQFLSSGVLSTTDLLDAMLTASIPDPVERQKAIAAYLAATGASNSIGNNTNYFSNVFQRVKSFQVGYSLQSAHSTSTLSFYKTRSAALSTQRATNDLLGDSLASLNNNLDTIGASLSYVQRMTQTTQLLASLNAQRSKTLDSGIDTNNQNARLGLTHTFSNKLSGSTEIRHNRGSYFNTGNSRYRENAISATIAMQF